MKKTVIYALCFLLSLNAYAAAPKDDYDTLKKSMVKQFEKQTPKEWGENVKGVKTQLVTKQKTIAITAIKIFLLFCIIPPNSIIILKYLAF